MKPPSHIVVIYIFIGLVFFLCCQNTGRNIPFPQQETEYQQPLPLPYTLGAPKKVKWRILDTVKAPAKTPIDEAKLPSVPFHEDGFKPMEKPIPETPIRSNLQTETPLHLDKISIQKFSFNNTPIGKPGRAKASWPHLKNGVHRAIYEYAVENGLSTGGDISRMIQDSKGFIWISSDNGLIRFDGEYFETYAASQGLHAFSVSSLLTEDKMGQIWAGFTAFARGFDIINLDSGIIRNLDFSIFLNKSSDKISGISPDASGKMWIGTSCGLAIMDPLQSTIQFITHANGLFSDTVKQVIAGEKGQVWISTARGGLDLVDLNESRIKHFGGIFEIPDEEINTIFKDHDENIWIGSDHGVDILSLKNKSVSHLSHQQGLANDSVYIFAETNQGQIWVWSNYAGNNGGDINVFDLKNRQMMALTGTSKLSETNWLDEYMVDNQGHIWLGGEGCSPCIMNFKNGMLRRKSVSVNDADNAVKDLFEDSKGRIWIHNSTLNYLNRKNNQIKTFNQSSGLPPMNGIKKMTIEDGLGRIWTFGGSKSGAVIIDLNLKTLIHLTTANGLSDSAVTNLYKDRLGKIWVGTKNGGITLFDPPNGTIKQLTTSGGLSDNYVITTAIDDMDRVWMVTKTGIGVLDLKNSELRYLVCSLKDQITDVFQSMKDSMGRIWIESLANGVFMIDPVKQTMINFREQQGLSNDHTTGLMEKNGTIYVNTSNGISLLTPQKTATGEIWKVMSLGKPQLLTHTDFNVLPSLSTSDGQLWWGINGDGVTILDPAAPDTTSTPIYITGIDIGNQSRFFSNASLPDPAFRIDNDIRWDSLSRDWHLPAHLVIPYNQNEIAFHFTAMQFGNIDKTRYRYTLEGIDNAWSKISDKPYSETYRNLNQGDYEFKVASMGMSGIWSRPISFQFSISPPWWETWWFRTITGFLVAFVLYGIYLWRTATLRRQKRALEQTVKERTAEVVEEKVEIERQKNIIEKEKEKSEELLLNILPSEVADELKEKGYTTAKSFEEATILFSDIKGFTHVAEQMTAQQLVKEIDTYFSSFDRIMQRYGLEKIKTIGDAYIAAGGLPDGNSATPQKVVEAAIAMQHAVEEFKNERIQTGAPHFELRIGIHTGPVVAGVVGIKKFQYDIWGDTVNLAARMEQSGEPGKINISQNTYELVKDDFNCLHRGRIEAKNKGAIDMYFVEIK